MNESSSIDRSPFDFGEGDCALLLIHGYTSSPAELRPMGHVLAKSEMRVVCPLLPGHGTSASDLNRYHWRDMAECVATRYYDLLDEHEQVFVGGVSMGGLLTLHLAQRIPEVAGIIPMAPALYLSDRLHHLLPFLSVLPMRIPKNRDLATCVEDASCGPLVWSYDQTPVRFAAELVRLMHHVRDRLKQVRCPILAIHGARDRAVPLWGSEGLIRTVSSEDRELLALCKTGHCLTVDGERHKLFAHASKWLKARRSRPRA